MLQFQIETSRCGQDTNGLSRRLKQYLEPQNRGSYCVKLDPDAFHRVSQAALNLWLDPKNMFMRTYAQCGLLQKQSKGSSTTWKRPEPRANVLGRYFRRSDGSVPAMSVELFRYRGAAKDGGS